MAKKIIYNEDNSILERGIIRQSLVDKYFNLFMNNLKILDTNYQEENFIKRRFWWLGSVAVFKNKIVDKKIFVDYSVSEYNIYDFPVKAQPINRKGVSFIPNELMEIDKEICLIFAQHNKKPICSIVYKYINEITDVEMVIRQQLKSHKIPFVMTGDELTKDKLKDFFNKINADEGELYMTADELDSINALNLNTNFIIDKLDAYKKQLENELKEYLGINNLGTTEKKEHLINSEVESNDEVVNISRASIIDTLNIYFDNCNKVLRTNLKAVYNAPDEESEEEEGEND